MKPLVDLVQSLLAFDASLLLKAHCIPVVGSFAVPISAPKSSILCKVGNSVRTKDKDIEGLPCSLAKMEEYQAFSLLSSSHFYYVLN